VKLNIKVFLLEVLLLCAVLTQAQHKPNKKIITIKGKVQFQNSPEGMKYLGYNFNKVYLGHREGRDFKMVDSFTLKEDGLWQFKVDATRPKFYDIDIVKWDRVTVWADADINMNCRGCDTARMPIKNPPFVFVEGSADNNFINLVEHANYRNYQAMIVVSKEQYYAGKIEDSTWASYLKKNDGYKQLSIDYYDRLKVLIKAYHERPVVLFGIKRLNWEREQDFILPILANLEKKYPWFNEIADYKKKVEDNIAQAKLLKPGMPVPVVAYNDPKGKPVSIADYKGKYLLIDFWASWCGPCRSAIPKVKDLYTKYKEKGFEVLSISIDKDEKAWRKAMVEEGMPWAQTLSPDMNKTMDQFLFSGIPTLYLIDREGKIVKSYTGYAPEVDEKIKEIFGF
jgi:thiol-disulfide isomerase/thioredoxin